jgi:hypothetical protein
METLRSHIRLNYSLLLSLLAAATVLFVFQGVVVPGFFVAGHGAISELQAAQQQTRVSVKAKTQGQQLLFDEVVQSCLLFSRFLYEIGIPLALCSFSGRHFNAVCEQAHVSSPSRASPA